MLDRTLLIACLTLAFAGCEGCLGRGTVEALIEASDVEPGDREELEASWAEGRLPESILAGEPRRGGSVTIRAYYEPDTLDPLAAASGITQWIVLHNVVETLVRRDPYQGEGEEGMQPALAKSWEVDEAGTTFTFRLREDASWHDGHPLTSRDVLATYAKLRDPLVTAGEHKLLHALLEEVTAPDEHTVVIKWRRPYFLALDTIASTPILPAHILESVTGRSYNDAATNPLITSPIGTGPFRFAGWERGERIVLERNEAWWGEGPWLDEVVYRIVPDHDRAEELARSGALDVWDAVQPHTWIAMEEDEELRARFHRSRSFSPSYVFIGWNTRQPHLLDAHTRGALARLFDREALLAGALRGLAKPATCHFHFESEDCDPDLEGPAYDPGGALETLAELGWSAPREGALLEREGSIFRIELMIYPASGLSEHVATMMQDAYRAVGIDVRIHRVEWRAMTGKLRTGEFDATILMWSPGADPFPYWHSTSRRSGANYFGFASRQADALMDEARSNLDDASRQESFRELGRILHSEQPLTFLYHPPRLALVRRGIRGVRPSLGWWQPRDWWVDQK